jgi:flagellar hook assembly protein FlgD
MAEQIPVKQECLLTAYPNPATEKGSVKFNNDKEGFVTLEVYDIQGKKVKDIINKKMEKGPFSAEWDLSDQSGSKVGSGVYFAKLVNAEQAISTKIIIK